MGKKKFIDKKKAATFQLLARDSSDPTYDGSLANDRVFVRVDNNNGLSTETFAASDEPYRENDPDSIFADAAEEDEGGDVNGFGGGGVLPENVRREILELGFPDDGYNYLLHLREIKNAGGGSAFYHNPKFRADLLPHDVKVLAFSCWLCVYMNGVADFVKVHVL